MRRSILIPIVLALLGAAAWLPNVGIGATAASHDQAAPTTAKAIAFQTAMRDLWDQHVTWTRLFIVSAAADLPDLGPTTDRLLRNQTDIGNAVAPYYGDAAGKQLTALLDDHIRIAADVVGAAKANDAVKLKDAQTRWYANADEIATFLSRANPTHWPVAEMKAMMHAHLDATTAEAVARLHRDWAADIAAFDDVRHQIQEMAAMLSGGIIAQFPQRFA